MKSTKMTILIYTCWKNHDMWDVFSKLFKKYWHDCPYRVLCLTDYCEEKNDEWVFDEIISYASNWYDMIENGLKVSKTKWVSLWMDDYLLCDYIQNENIEYYIQKAEQHHAGNLRLVESPTIPSKIYANDPELNYYEPGSAYCFSTQIGIWDADYLKANMKVGWSAWDFERIGSIEAKDREHPLLASKNYTFPYEEGVRQGKWMDNGVRLCKRNNITLDFTKRRQMSNFELSWIYFKGGILESNPTVIVKIQNIINRLKKGK